MKISCEIIKDLLPLYNDGVCSEESKAVIEEHLSHCDICKAALSAMKEDVILDRTNNNLNEVESVKKLSKRWKRGMKASMIKGILIALGIIILIVGTIYLFMDIKIIF